MSRSRSEDKPHFLKKHQAIVIPVGVVLGVALGFGAGFLLYKYNPTFKQKVDSAHVSVKNKFSKRSDPDDTADSSATVGILSGQ